MSLISVTDEAPTFYRRLHRAGKELVKLGEEAAPSYDLSGMLYATGHRIVLSVPNALVRGVFAALDEPGLELPPGKDDQPFSAHITVIRPDELTQLGGAERITERGKRFAYRLGGLVTVEPDWPGMSKVWMIRVHSPELQALRRSYGLSSLPNAGKYDFHISVAVRRKGVLGRNEKAKAAVRD